MRAPGFSAGSGSKIVFFSGPAPENAGNERLVVFLGARGCLGTWLFMPDCTGGCYFRPLLFANSR